MSGSIGGKRIRREEVQPTLDRYIEKVLSKMPGFVSAQITGSYNAGTRKDHGDIDLAVHIKGTNVAQVKKAFKAHLDGLDLPEFVTGKNQGKKSQLYGAIVTCGFPIFGREDDYVQIDNIIVTNENEQRFQRQFLDLDAAKQGLVMGYTRTILHHKDANKILEYIGLVNLPKPSSNQEYEFVLSSAGLSFRLVTLNADMRETNREELWRSANWDLVEYILDPLDLSKSYEELLDQVAKIVKNDNRSKRRIVGIMKSMIKVGPGEVGTPKGDGKIAAIERAETILKESRKMISLYESLLAIFEANNEMYILKTQADAFEFFDVKPDSDAGKLIEYMYSIAPENPDTETGYSSPFVGAYGGKKGFACRRWVKDNPSLTEYMEKNNIDFKTAFDGHPFKDYHDTKLEKIDGFPTSADEEIFIAMSLNVKSVGEDNAETAMKYALFGDENKKLSSKEQKIFDKFYKYYNDHKQAINARADDFNVKKGDLFTKCSNASVKNDIKDNWKEDGDYTKYPNYTPKTDIISKNGRKISIKKSDGAQAMSGGMNETMATLMTYSYLLDEETQKKIDSLFKDDDGNPIDWNGVNRERNRKLNDTIKDIFKNKDKNKAFIMAVLTESLTGAGKFGEDSDGASNEILTWSKDGKLIKDDIETYIYKTYQELSEKSVTINHKSAGKTWTVMRILLPKHESSYKTLTDKEREENKELLEIIKSVRENESIKSRISQEEEVELKDEDGKTKKVTIKTGSRGGKYYISPTSKKQVYVQRNKSGSYEIKSN